MEDEALLALEGAAEPSGHGELRERVVAVDRVDEVPVAAVVLGLVHGRVRMLEQGRSVRRVQRVQADPDARAHEDLDAGDDEGLAEAPADPARDGFGCVADAVHVERSIGWRVAEHQQEELVAAVARHDLVRARRAPQAFRDGDQELVPGLVPEAVVDELEVVEVDEEDGEHGRLRVVAAHRLLEPLLEGDAVREAGQRVVVGNVPQLALRGGEGLGGLLPVGDVDDDSVDEQAPVLGPPGVHPIPDPADAIVVADEAVFDLERLAALDRLVRGVVAGAVVRVNGVLPGLLGRPVRGEGPEQALEAGADERVADVRPVRLRLHLVEVDGDGSGHALKDVARGERLSERAMVVVAGDVGHGPGPHRGPCRHRQERRESEVPRTH